MAKEITLPSGRIARIKEGKGKDFILGFIQLNWAKRYYQAFDSEAYGGRWETSLQKMTLRNSPLLM